MAEGGSGRTDEEEDGQKSIGPLLTIHQKKMNVHIFSAENIQVGHGNTMHINDDVGKKATKRKTSVITTTSTAEVTQKQIDAISHQVKGDWKELARQLRLTTGEIETIDIDCGHSHDFEENQNYEKAYQSLKKWKERKGLSATVNVLAKHLVDIGLEEIAGTL